MDKLDFKNVVKDTAFLFFLGILSVLVSCSSNPNKAKEIETNLEKSQNVGAGLKLGLNDKGEMITQKKVEMAQVLSQLQTQVAELELDIYGEETLGRAGLYGVLQECLDKAVETKNGGDGKLRRLPERAVLVPLEDHGQTKIGLDEKENLVSVSEEFLLDRIKRYEYYRAGYLKQKDDFKDRIRICKAELKK